MEDEGNSPSSTTAQFGKRSKGDDSPQHGFLSRIKHFTWAWNTLTTSTGGIALLLSEQPHSFRGLMTVGKVIYIFNIVLFIAICLLLLLRFTLNTGSLTASLRHPVESLFFPTFWLSIATIVSGMQRYGVPSTGSWLVVAIRILFWLYVACSFLVAVLQYYYLFTAKKLTVPSMTPAWILPIFPVTLTGTIASVTAGYQPPDHAMAIVVAGLTFQGLGMIVYILMCSQYIARLMQYGLPAPNLRPGMFIAVGPPAFTSLALIGMARAIPDKISYFGDHATAKEALSIMATVTAIFIWSLSFWWFSICSISCIACAKEMSFHLSWWAFVFPNTGFTIATIEIGIILQSQGILWLTTAMSIGLVAMWCFVFPMHIRALWQKQILWEGKDEDL